MDFRIYENTEWVDTKLPCGRCGDEGYTIMREVYKNGEKTDHVACRRLGCTWAGYHKNEIVEKLDQI